MMVSLRNACMPDISDTSTVSSIQNVVFLPDWGRCDDNILYVYRCTLDSELSKINISAVLLDMVHRNEGPNDSPNSYIQSLIDVYYNSIVRCIKTAYNSSLSKKRVSSHYERYVVPW